MRQNLLNAEFVSGEYPNAKIKTLCYPGHESAYKGVPAHAGKLLPHICLPSIVLIVLIHKYFQIVTGHSI